MTKNSTSPATMKAACKHIVPQTTAWQAVCKPLASTVRTASCFLMLTDETWYVWRFVYVFKNLLGLMMRFYR